MWIVLKKNESQNLQCGVCLKARLLPKTQFSSVLEEFSSPVNSPELKSILVYPMFIHSHVDTDVAIPFIIEQKVCVQPVLSPDSSHKLSPFGGPLASPCLAGVARR